ncbi:hypothetical protein [Salmonella phage SD-6_S16]|nr:hypothetical protein [Salmonella phage SD-6_S16]
MLSTESFNRRIYAPGGLVTVSSLCSNYASTGCSCQQLFFKYFLLKYLLLVFKRV